MPELETSVSERPHPDLVDEAATSSTSPPAGRPATHRLEVEVAHARRDLVAAHLWAAGACGVWERPAQLVAWFEDHPDGTAVELPEPDGIPELAVASRRWSREEDRDWQADWKATIRPVHAGRTVIVPTWLEADHEPAPDELTLIVDPGRAFGTGHHATTVLCLELLDELDLAGNLQGRTVTDVGCGTGVLAIAAAARGAIATAVDIDPDAVEVTRDNAARNGVEVTALAGGVSQVPAAAEVVVANLITDTVRSLAAELVAASTDELIVSGIALERERLALDALVAAGAQLLERRERDGWLAVRCRSDARRGDAGGRP